MSDALDFVYSLDVARLTGPAGEAARALGALNERLATVAASIAKLEASGGGLGRLGKAFESSGRSSSKAADDGSKAARRIAEEWERLAARAERAEARRVAAADRATQALGRAHAAAIAEDQRRAASAERAAERVAKANARAAEKAAHKSYFGGEKSLGDLFGARAEAKTSGIVTSVADGILGGPVSLLSGAVGAIGSLVSGGASLAYSLGRAALSAQAIREESVEGFRAIYGSAEIGDKLFDEARRFANKTKFATSDVVNVYNTLAANNFTADELSTYAAAVADIESARKGKGLTFLSAIARIRGNKTATFGNLQSAGLQGPGIENVFNEVADIKGLSRDTSRKQFQDYFREGKVTREEALRAVTQAIAKKYDTGTGKLGEYAEGQGEKTFSGLLSNIQEGFGNALNSKLIANSESLGKFKDLLRAIGASGGLFDETSERGQRFATVVSKFVDDVFTPLGGLSSSSTTILDKLLEGAELLEVKFHNIVLDVTQGINEAFADPDNALGNLAAKVGIAIGGGIIRGILHELPGGGNAQTQLADLSPTRNAGGRFFSGDLTTGSSVPASVPSHASGGRVAGDYYGQPRLILAHVGEVVSGLQGEYADSLTNGRSTAGSGGGDEYNFNFYGCSSQEAIQAAILQTFTMMPRNNTPATTPG